MFLIDRNKYLLEMKALLGFMDTDDRDQVLAHYGREFDRAGEEGEDALIESLGSPLRQVLQVEKLYRERHEKGLPLYEDEEYEEPQAEEYGEEAPEEYADKYSPEIEEDGEYYPVEELPEEENTPEAEHYAEEAAPEEYFDEPGEEEESAAPLFIPVIVPAEEAETEEDTEEPEPVAAAETEESAGKTAENVDGPVLLEDEDAEFLRALMASTYALNDAEEQKEPEAAPEEEQIGLFDEEAPAPEETDEEEDDSTVPPLFVLPNIEDFGADRVQEDEEESNLVELPSEILSDAAGEMLSEINFGMESDEEPEPPVIFDEKFIEEEEKTEKDDVAEEKEEDADEAEEKPGAGRVILTVLLTPFIVLAAVICVALTFAVAALPLAVCAAFGGSCVYLTLYAVTSMTYLPDMLTVIGVSVALLAVTVLFLWTGIYLLIRGIRLTIRLISGIYGRLLKKGER